MIMQELKRFKNISDYHKFANLSSPEHPLISLIDYSLINYSSNNQNNLKWIQDYYTIGLKRNVPYKFFYGQQQYDFDEGIMTFIAPNQVMSLTENPNIKHNPTGWLLLIHPDFLWNSHLATKIKKYDFFEYSINEALFLSEKEEQIMIDILQNIQHEYQSNIDEFSQKIVISHIEVLLNYANRYYNRQFITRKISNHHIVNKLEVLLNNYFEQESLIDEGIPTVTWIASQLNFSPNYLSNLLKSITGQSTQNHIHNKVIEEAKKQLSSTQLSISEIAYHLGFEHVPSFSKLFKNKTAMSPLEFRKTFN